LLITFIVNVNPYFGVGLQHFARPAVNIMIRLHLELLLQIGHKYY